MVVRGGGAVGRGLIGRDRKHAVPMVTQTEGSGKRGSEADTHKHSKTTQKPH